MFELCHQSGEILSIIARFDPVKNSWAKIGDLNVARAGHGVIQVRNEFIVVGGVQKDNYLKLIPTESCNLKANSVICTLREPNLYLFTSFPELIPMT